MLVVESDETVAKQITSGLRKDSSLIVQVARGGYEALWATVDRLPDLVVLDLDLPDLAGSEICRILRGRERTAQIPIIILSASGVAAGASVDAGADDWLTKPFSIDELQTRVRLSIRRHTQQHHMRAYEGRHISANFGDGFVAVDGTRIDLTRREFALLWYFVDHRDKVIPAERLLQDVWGASDIQVRTVITHVGRLRTKLGPAGNQIQTVVGKGYIFSEPAGTPRAFGKKR